MFDKKMISWLLVGFTILFGLIMFKSALPWLFFFISALGWILLLVVVLSLTGLQNKLMKAAGQNGGLVVTKKVTIPFVGTAEITSVSGSEVVLKLKKQRK